MSTRCNIHFTETWGDGGQQNLLANVYQHSDGYPDGVLPELQEFFEAVEAQTSDTRFTDAQYLAAKFVVWQAWQMAKINGRFSFGEAESTVAPLDFLGVGVTQHDAGDGEYVYTVDCTNLDENGRPTVTYKER